MFLSILRVQIISTENLEVQNENDTKMCKQKLIFTTQLIFKNAFLSQDAFMKNLKSYNQLLLHEK